MPTPRIIIVTGANRGIGRAICQSILSKPEISPLKLLATSRKGEDLALETGGDADREVIYPALDISSAESVKAFAEGVVQPLGRVDLLVNNAGVNLDGEYGPENARRTLEVNYRGTLRMCHSLLPYLSASPSNPRIVNLSSIASSLKHYSPAIQARFRNPALTLPELESLAQEFEHAVSTSTEVSAGFGPPRRSYSISKACVNAFTRILAASHPHVEINACCPGWAATDMGVLVGPRPPKTAEEGARVPLHLAFGDLGGVSGAYWANPSVRGRGEGQVMEW